MGILCNTLLILAIIVDPLGVLRKGAWVTILNLAVADFLSCATNFVDQFLVIADEHSHKIFIYHLRAIIAFFSMFSMSASFMSLTLLTVQVYMFIKYPIKSRLILTKTKVALACLVVWVLAVLLGLSQIAIALQLVQGRIAFIPPMANFVVVTLVVVIQVVFKVLIVVEILRSRHDDVNAEIQNKKQKDLAKTRCHSRRYTYCYGVSLLPGGTDCVYSFLS